MIYKRHKAQNRPSHCLTVHKLTDETPGILNAFQIMPWFWIQYFFTENECSWYLTSNVVDSPDMNKWDILGSKCVPICLDVFIGFFVFELWKQKSDWDLWWLHKELCCFSQLEKRLAWHMLLLSEISYWPQWHNFSISWMIKACLER